MSNINSIIKEAEVKRIYSNSHGKVALYVNGKFIRWEKR